MPTAALGLVDFAHWRQQRSLAWPSVLDALTNSLRTYSTFASPLRERLSFPCQSYPMIIAAIVVLSDTICPCTIPRLVIAVIIFTLQCHPGRSLAYIREEILELQPSFANGDTAPAVIVEAVIGGILAAPQHVRPRAVFSRFQFRVSVLGLTNRDSCRAQTSTRIYCSTRQTFPDANFEVATIAPAFPFDWSAEGCLFNDGQKAVTTTDSIHEIRHGGKMADQSLAFQVQLTTLICLMASGNGSVTRITTGSLDWSAGVNSDLAPTVRGPGNPNGLPQNALAWGNSISLRHGTITHRPGFQDLAAFATGIGIHQESFLYTPLAESFPYIIAQIAGRTFKVTVDTVPAVITEITIPGNPNPPDRPQAWMAQGEEFLIIQDGISLPLIWDGVVLRRSAGPSTVLVEVASNFLVPAVGSSVLVTLLAPFPGPNGSIVYVNGQQFTASTIAAGNWITLRNDSNGSAGATQAAGASVNNAVGTLLTTITSAFIIPAIGASTKVPVDPNFPSATPTTVGITNAIQDFTVLDEIAPVAGANQIFLTNVSGVAGTAVVINSQLLSEGELPTAEPMVYYQGRFWLAIGREYIAGDIVGGPSGTAPYGLRDSILKMTENSYTALGGTFTVPTTAGNIRALNYPQNINSFLGQGPLLIFTREQVYAADIPISRSAWAAATGATGITVKVMQINFGTTSDRSVVHVNGDVFYQATDGVRSLTTAVRNFGEWGDLPISVEESRAVDQNDRALLRFGSGINFSNRLLQTCLPQQSDVGVIHKGIMPLDFDLLSTLQAKLPPSWAGLWVGLDVLRLLRGDFGGRERAFALIRSSITGGIELWELTDHLLEDNNTFGDSRISWMFELPSFTWGNPFQLKELDTVEYWVDRISGVVDIAWEIKTDQHSCWEPWWKHQICTPRNSCEDCGIAQPCDYPEQIYPRGYRATIVLPKPPTRCEITQGRPINIGYSFQFRVFVKGSMRVRGIMVHAFPRDKSPYESVTPVCFSPGCGT